MSAALSETVTEAVDRIKQPLQSAARVTSMAAEEAAKRYAAMFDEAQKRNAAEFEKLMNRRNVIDILSVISAVCSLAMATAFFYIVFFRR